MNTHSTDGKIRVSDNDRDLVVAILREHTVNGRLDAGEFEQRVGSTYAATVVADLERLVDDLPVSLDGLLPVPDRIPQEPGTQGHRPLNARHPYVPGAAGSPELRELWTRWMMVNLVCLVIWGAISAGSAEITYFWPIWVFGPWGAVLLGRSLLERVHT